MDKILILTYIIINFSAQIWSQEFPYETDKLKNWELKGYAQSAEKQEDIYSAILFYEQLAIRKPNRIKYINKQALLQHKNKNYKEAIRLFSLIDSIEDGKAIHAKYYLALNYKYSQQYSKAYEILKKIKRAKPNRYLPSDIKNRVLYEIEGVELALAFKDSTINQEIQHLGNSINKAHIEFCPRVLTDSVMIFGSSNIDTLKFVDTDTNRPRRKFFMAKKIGKEWVRTDAPHAPYFNSEGYHTGDGVFSLDKKRFYFTRCNENWEMKTICHLYVSELVNGQWSEPVKLNEQINYRDYSSSQPAIGTCYNPMLEVIYYITDRKGGYGEKDIWYTIYDTKTGKYKQPINAGIYINTSGNEASPFYDPSSHTMYFSSDGWGGIGGMDIYSTEGDMVNWTEPKNLGFPINSSFDDLYYCISESGKMGFFTSNRVGGNSLVHETCCDDIYQWQQSTTEKVRISGVLESCEYKAEEMMDNQDENTPNCNKNLLDRAKLNLFMKKDTSNMVFIKQLVTSEKGEFSFTATKGNNYEIKVEDKRVLDKTISFSTQKVDAITDKLVLEPMEVKTLTQEPIKLKNIYYDFNKSNLTTESKEVLINTLVKLMTQYEHISIEIMAHTDDVGNEKYNLKLSQKRANNVVKFLMANGIKPYRLNAIGYGESHPIVPNKNEDGTDNIEGRAINRRTEFRLVEGK